MAGSPHPLAVHDIPSFITGPGETDVLFAVVVLTTLAIILATGSMFLWLHTLPERIAHKSQKLQFEIVAILGLLALFTHIHLFWVAGLLLAFIEFPDFSTPLARIAGSLEKLAGVEERADEAPPVVPVHAHPPTLPPVPALDREA